MPHGLIRSKRSCKGLQDREPTGKVKIMQMTAKALMRDGDASPMRRTAFIIPDPEWRRSQQVIVKGRKGKQIKFNTYDRELLEKGDPIGSPVLPNVHAVGETIKVDGRFWTVTGICPQCRWCTGLQPVREYSDEGALPAPRAVDCECSGHFDERLEYLNGLLAQL